MNPKILTKLFNLIYYLTPTPAIAIKYKNSYCFFRGGGGGGGGGNKFSRKFFHCECDESRM